MRHITIDEKFAFVYGELSDEEIQEILDEASAFDFEHTAIRVGLDAETLRKISTDPNTLGTVYLNPNRVSVAQLEKIPGFDSEHANNILKGRPYYTIEELEEGTGLSRTLLDDLFLIRPFTSQDKLANREISLTPVPGRYIVPLPQEFEEDPVVNIGFSELVPPAVDFNYRVIQPQDFDVTPNSLALKTALRGNVHPVLRDSDGFERYLLPGSLELWFKPAIPEEQRNSIIENLGLEITASVSSIGYYLTALMSKPNDLNVVGAVFDRIEQAHTLEEIRFAEPAYVGYEDFEPEMEVVGGDDDLEAADRFWSHDAINLVEAHAITRGSADVVIYVIDSGTRMDHEDLTSSFYTNWQNFDLNFDLGVPEIYASPDERVISHGTKVTGVISGQGHNEVERVRGIAPGCRVLPIKISGKSVTPAYGFRAAAILAALQYLQDDTHPIINISWRTNGEHIGIREALREAQAKGAVIVTSAGNYPYGAPQEPNEIHYPSAHTYKYPELTALCSVAAVGFGDRKASYSYYGTKSVTIAACGGERGGSGSGIYTTSTPEKYIYTQGTSFAAPQVASLCALLFSMKPDLSAEEAIRIIKETADPIDDVNPTYAGMLGAGRINAGAALNHLIGIKNHMITAFAGPNGTISPQGKISAANGADQKFEMVADAGHHISKLLINGAQAEIQAAYTFANITTPHTIEVYFTLDEPQDGSHYDEMGRLNINLATAEEICAIPLIGRWRAQRTVQHREINGPYSSIWGLAQTLVFDAWLIGLLKPVITV